MPPPAGSRVLLGCGIGFPPPPEQAATIPVAQRAVNRCRALMT
jgi:hypothetical protein